MVLWASLAYLWIDFINKIALQVQDVAHTVGDILKLAFRVQNAEADLLGFCDMNFTVDIAKVLAPTKTVLVSALEATFSLIRLMPYTAGRGKTCAAYKVLPAISWLLQSPPDRVS